MLSTPLESTVVSAKVIPFPTSLDFQNSSPSAFCCLSSRAAGHPVAMCARLSSLAELVRPPVTMTSAGQRYCFSQGLITSERTAKEEQHLRGVNSHSLQQFLTPGAVDILCWIIPLRDCLVPFGKFTCPLDDRSTLSPSASPHLPPCDQ